MRRAPFPGALDPEGRTLGQEEIAALTRVVESARLSVNGGTEVHALEREFGFAPPREHGYDVVRAIRALRDGDAKVFLAMGGNFVAASPDTLVTEAAMRRARLTVHVSTKLNRSHVVTGARALILPTLGRTEKDVQAGGAQFVTVETFWSAKLIDALCHSAFIVEQPSSGTTT